MRVSVPLYSLNYWSSMWVLGPLTFCNWLISLLQLLGSHPMRYPVQLKSKLNEVNSDRTKWTTQNVCCAHLVLCTVPNIWYHMDCCKEMSKWECFFFFACFVEFMRAHLRQTLIQFVQIVRDKSIFFLGFKELVHWIIEIPEEWLNNTLRHRGNFGIVCWHWRKANILNSLARITELFNLLLQSEHSFEECLIEYRTKLLKISIFVSN